MVLETELLMGKGLKNLILKQKSRPTAAKTKIKRFSDTYRTPSKACDKKLPASNSKGDPPPSVARPALQNPFFLSILNCSVLGHEVVGKM